MNGLWVYLIAINIVTFFLFGIDKWKAVHGSWRIKEATLLGCCFIGGALGGLIAMYTFRHKTRKLKFTIPVPIMLMVQIALIIYLKRQ